MADPRTDLPSPSASNFNQRVREALMTYMGRQGNMLERGMTLRDLVDAGLIELQGNRILASGNLVGVQGPPGPVGPVGPPGGVEEPDLTPPPTPTNFVATAAISNVFVEHDAPLYSVGHGHLRTRLYGAIYSGGPLPTFVDAAELSQFTGTVFAYPSNPATTWHLWAKWETNDGVLSSSPAGGTNGVVVTTGQDVALLLEALTGQITESQLYAALGERINLIDGNAPGSVNARIQTEVADRTSAIAAEAGARTLADGVLGSVNAALQTHAAGLVGSVNGEAVARTAANDIIGSALAAVGAASGQNAAAVRVESDSRVDADASTASQTAVLVASHGANAAALTVEQQTRADENLAMASQVTSLASVTGANAAALTVEQQTRSDDTSALASQTTTLLAATANASAGLVSEQSARVVDDLATASAVTALAATSGANAAAIASEQQVRVDEDSAMASQLNVMAATVGANSAAISTEQQVRVDEDSAQASQIVGLAAAVGSNAAALSVEQQTRADDSSAMASQITNLQAATGDNAAAIRLEQQVRTDEDSSMASQNAALAAATANATAGLFVEQEVRADENSATASAISGLAVSTAGNSAGILQEQSARATSDSANASQLNSLSAAVGGNAAAIQEEFDARITSESATASQISTLSTSAGANTAAIQAEQQVRASETGNLFAKYTIKVDLNGYVSGFGLASEANDGVTVSDFAVRADKFYVASPTGPGIEPAVPFIVQTTPTTINGVSVPAGVYIDAAYIYDLTAAISRMGKAWIDDAKIADLAANKVTAGFMEVGQFISSANYRSRKAGWFIDAKGDAEFNNVTVRGTVASGQIQGGTAIYGGAAQAYNYGLGFYSGYDGGTYKWRVGDPSGARMQWTGTAVEVYNASNVMTMSSGGVEWSKIVDDGSKPADGATKNVVSYASTAPSSPVNGDIWVDTSVTPNVAKIRVSGAWQTAANNTTNTNQLTDGANLGGTADWTGVSGTGKPADNATKNILSQGLLSARPTGADGDFYYATDNGLTYQKVGGSWITTASRNTASTGLLSARPTSNAVGDTYYATDTGLFYVCTTAPNTWTTGASRNTASSGLLSSRPTANAAGDTYYATDTGLLYVCTTAPNTWTVGASKNTGSTGTLASRPTANTVGDTYYATDTGLFYVCTTAPNTWTAGASKNAAGSGTLATRPTANAVGDTYYATDNGTLYLCTTAPNTWATSATYGANATNFDAVVGGENLLPNSDMIVRSTNTPTGFGLYNNGGVGGSFVASTGYLSGSGAGVKAGATVGTTFGIYTDSALSGGISGGWLANQTYTVSFYARKVNGAGFTNMGFAWNTNPSSVTAVENPTLTTSYQRYVFRIVWGATVEGSGRLYFNRQGTTAANDELHFDRIMVSLGDVAPEWSAGRMDSIGLSNKLSDTNIGNYFDSAAITNAYIGNQISSTNFNGTIDASGNITANGTTGWAIGKGGKAVFQDVVARGDIEAQSLKANTVMVNTGNIASLAVDTLQIANQAVTIPVGAYTAASTSTNPVQSATITSTGAPILITVSGLFGGGFTNLYSSSAGTVSGSAGWRVKRGVTTVFDSGYIVTWSTYISAGGYGSASATDACSLSFIDTPGAGSVTYTVEIYDTGSGAASASLRSITLLEVKK